MRDRAGEDDVTAVKSFPVNLGVSSGMPTSLFDPKWHDPAIATRVAYTIYCRIPAASFSAATTLLTEPQAPDAANSDARKFALARADRRGDDDAIFKGGSYGELHRRYAFGTHTVNFHAQAVAFGVDSAGRFFLSAVVGRFDGPWGNDGALAAAFYAGQEHVGTASWWKVLDPTGDHRVVVAGTSPTIRAAFDRIDRALVTFTCRTGVEAASSDTSTTTSPKLSRARRSALSSALAAAKKRGDVAEAARIEAQLLAGKT